MDAFDCRVWRNKNEFIQEDRMVHGDTVNVPLLMLFVLVMTNVEKIVMPFDTPKCKHGHHDLYHHFELANISSLVCWQRITFFFWTQIKISSLIPVIASIVQGFQHYVFLLLYQPSCVANIIDNHIRQWAIQKSLTQKLVHLSAIVGPKIILPQINCIYYLSTIQKRNFMIHRCLHCFVIYIFKRITIITINFVVGFVKEFFGQKVASINNSFELLVWMDDSNVQMWEQGTFLLSWRFLSNSTIGA